MAKFTFLCFMIASCVVAGLGQTCGKSTGMRMNRPHDPSGRIVGGVEPRPNSHPWIVTLKLGGIHSCGGTLISVGNPNKTDIVVTAAHCIHGYSAKDLAQLTVTAGAHDLTKPTSTEQAVYVADMKPHKEYNDMTTVNDIALLKLKTPIQFTTTAQPACLPANGEQVPDGTEGTVAGWGLTSENAMDNSKILMQVGVPVISQSSCATMYAKHSVAINSTIMLCAGYPGGGKDSCQRDSGGPLVFKSANGYVLQGVVSFGVGCARAGAPGIYARVSNYIPWINKEVKGWSIYQG